MINPEVLIETDRVFSIAAKYFAAIAQRGGKNIKVDVGLTRDVIGWYLYLTWMKNEKPHKVTVSFSVEALQKVKDPASDSVVKFVLDEAEKHMLGDAGNLNTDEEDLR